VAINQYTTKSKEPVQDTDEGPELKYKTVVQYFDVEAKMWKPLPSVAQLVKTQSFFCADYFGNYLYVAGKNQSDQFAIYLYHIVNNSWETLPPFLESNHKIDFLCSVDDHLYAVNESIESNPPQRYSLVSNNWQSGVKCRNWPGDVYKFHTVAAVVLENKMYVIRGKTKQEGSWKHRYWVINSAVLDCFDPINNYWEEKASTCRPHFGSSIFVVNDKLYVAGGKLSCYSGTGEPTGNPAPVEVYDDNKNTWSVVEQKHIPPNNLGAVEIEGRVYFIINKFPIDSGIRIPPEEMYHVHLNEWENLAKVSNKAVLCYLPVKRESLKTEHDESQAD